MGKWKATYFNGYEVIATIFDGGDGDYNVYGQISNWQNLIKLEKILEATEENTIDNTQ